VVAEIAKREMDTLFTQVCEVAERDALEEMCRTRGSPGPTGPKWAARSVHPVACSERCANPPAHEKQRKADSWYHQLQVAKHHLNSDLLQAIRDERSALDLKLERTLRRWAEDLQLGPYPNEHDRSGILPPPPPLSATVVLDEEDQSQAPVLPEPMKVMELPVELDEDCKAPLGDTEVEVQEAGRDQGLGKPAPALRRSDSEVQEVEQYFRDKPGGKVLSPAVRWVMTLEEPERHGFLACIAQSKRFEVACLFIIMLNTLFTFIQTNHEMRYGRSDYPQYYKMLEGFFTVFYTGELTLKLFVHRAFFFCNHDMRWNIADTVLVLVGILDFCVEHLFHTKSMMNPSHMRFLRLLRISKIFRIVRLLRFFSELRLMLKCVLGSLVSLCWSFLLLGGFTFVFAIVFVQSCSTFINDGAQISDDNLKKMRESFGSVQDALLTLFFAISGGADWSDFYKTISLTGPLNAGIFLVYILFVWLSVTNIITSIFIDKAMKLAQPDLDEMLLTKHKEDMANCHELRKVFTALDQNGSGTLSAEEFHTFTHDPRLVAFFEYKGLYIKDAELFFNMLLNVAKHDEVDIDSFVNGCLKMKGVALNIEVLSVQYELQMVFKKQSEFQEEFRKEMNMLDIYLKLLRKTMDHNGVVEFNPGPVPPRAPAVLDC